MAKLLSPLPLLSLLVCFVNVVQNSHATHYQNGFSLKMIHQYSPESPTYRANLTESEKIMEMLQISNARVKSLESSLTSSHQSNSLIVRPSSGFFVYNYYVQVGIGTFDKYPVYDTFYLGIDTGSDLTWTQCQGCQKCFPQVDPYFNPSLSKSYKAVSCYRCPSPCQGDDQCRLTRKYPDGSSVTAIGATETFNFQSVGNKYAAVPEVFFGCGETMLDFVKANIPNNKISGILGLGYGNFSFWKQQYETSQGRFSYCLQSPVTAREAKMPMYLRFGADIVEQAGMKSTPLHQYRERSQYYLTLEGITVANQRLGVGPSTFERKPDGSGGCIIDSGSYMSYLVSEAYRLLVTAVMKNIEINNRHLRKIPDPQFQGRRLCYQRFKGPPRYTLPIIKLHFSYNADFVMQPQAVFARNGPGKICMMIVESTQTEHSGITYLRFGADVIEQAGMNSTPLHQYRDRSQYYLTLEGISVADQRLPVGPSTFERKTNGSGGCIIDTGSYMTYIVSEAYNLLLSAVSNYTETKNQNLRKIADPDLKIRLCYERFKDPTIITLPIIRLHFSYSADFIIQPHALFAFGHAKNGHGTICMMILESTQKEHYGITYLGAHQQSNQRIIFDNKKGQLLFGTADCANNN